MARLRVEWREHAEQDLAELYQFIVDTHGLPDTAYEYAGRIIDRCEALSELPYAGRARDEILPGLRSIAFESVVILYLVEAQVVTIVNIMHRARDYARLLSSR